MLSSLYVKDFAIVEEVELTLGKGLTVISGETGAGKSLLVDALLFLGGARADAGMVRHGAERAELSAQFQLQDDDRALAWLREQELDDDLSCALRRVIRADGGSRAWINGRPVSAGQLSELAEQLIEIHGQHEHQALLQKPQQLALLDAWGRHANQLGEVRTQALNWQSARKQRDALLRQASDPGPQLELLGHQLAELEQHALSPNAFDELLAQHRRSAHALKLVETCQRVLTQLDGDDRMDLPASLRHLAHDLMRQAEFDPRLSEAADLLESAAIQTEEAALRVRSTQDDLELDPTRLMGLEDQLARLHDLARKHRSDARELQSKAQSLREEIEQLQAAGSAVAKLDAQLEALQHHWESAAKQLSIARRASALRFGQAVSEEMSLLGMDGGRVHVQIENNTDMQPDPMGAERIEFLVSTNAGQPPRALRKTASGGELSRISLAIEVAALGMDAVQTMVFDEVDTGIGGAVAEIVGQKLRRLGRERQVLCVTHLPQVAAQGHAHYSVRKQANDGVTRSALHALTDTSRCDELARMLGGVQVTDLTLAHARQMLHDAQRKD
ncbi:MAG: DNA repair protein RecN [Alphaproteobacteria bacterium ADurb.BinA280]|jgi:DNA repair protein RecN (Recombination protein N)|nr:DNA repair protein RecN [Xanthomonadales bacterium]MCC6506656.1 DNA repair protein RecN [Aquimonas sp.]OPZ11073.1 MAG: DNA repair protein RecN [Alphaproteobacteria bacterium ADurb.BinA280]